MLLQGRALHDVRGRRGVPQVPQRWHFVVCLFQTALSVTEVG